MTAGAAAPPQSGARFPHLLAPLAIGRVELRNRIVSAGHDTTLPTDGTVNDALIAYHEARAAGGVGMIVVQVAGVHETARYTSHLLMATDDACIPGYRRLVEACRAHGAVVVGQLFHPGREIMESQDGRAPVAYSASDQPTERFHVTPRPLALEEIAEIVDGYGASARRLVAAGLDGVEIVASHGYLPAQFLNPRVNHRADAYGGDRVRFLREVATTVRAADAAIVGLRISIDERTPDGLLPDEAIAAVAELADLGLIDYVNVIVGSSASLGGSVHIVPPMSVATGYTAPLARRVRDAVSIPVIVGGRINEPQLAERLLAAGDADGCAMTRALICDPELPAKAMRGDLDEIRACVACNQACIGHFHAGYPISCIQHPETGRELRFGRLPRATRARRVIVAGGGPAGLKAAAIAAARGHEVTLHEASRRLGGQIALAQLLPGRGELGGVTTNLAGEARRAGARIELESRVDAALVADARADVVIVATGGRRRLPPLELAGAPTVLHAWDVLEGAELPHGHVVVADARCDWVGPGLAIRCARAGRRVTLAVNGYMPGQRIQQYVRDELLAELHRCAVAVIPTARLFGADEDSVFLQHTTSGEPIIVEDVAALVVAHGPVSDDALAPELRRAGVEAVLVGDALAPRTAEEAVVEALEAAARL